MSRKELPRFVIYQPNAKEFHICLEMSDKYLRWCSYYAPTTDVRFFRRVTRIEDIASKDITKKKIFDRGTYTITKGDTRMEIEKKVNENINDKSFSFILNGKKLKGRFTLKRTSGGTILQKYKDKYAVEEDVLGGDLSRTISLMVPDYDEKKVKLNYRPAAKKKQQPKEEEEDPVEEITADKKIGNTTYHFALYTSENEPDIFLITNAAGEALLFQKVGNKWKALSAAGKSVLKKEKEFTDHIEALLKLQHE